MFGNALQQAWNAATAAARDKAQQMMTSARAAAQAVAAQAQQTAQAAEAKAMALAEAARDAAEAAKDAAMNRARALGVAAMDRGRQVAQAGANALRFGAGAAEQFAEAGLTVATRPFDTAKKLFYGSGAPSSPAVQQCPLCELPKRKRLQDRLDLINANLHSPIDQIRGAAQRLAQNNEAVELARLAKDSYDQFDPTRLNPLPPEGWSKLGPDKVSPEIAQLLAKSRAVLYQTPADWPGGQKIVAAFRGTADGADIIEDYNQAMNRDAPQYRAAMQLANTLKAEPWAKDIIATGHSLGGGKAQAFAGVLGSRGMGFNAAGPLPQIVEDLPGVGQMLQYRTVGDPLTGTQNSPAVQTLVAGVAGLGIPVGATANAVGRAASALGLDSGDKITAFGQEAMRTLPQAARNLLSNGQMIPPAIGPIHEVPALDKNGATLALLNLKGQHSIDTVINGIESQKTTDTAILQRSGR